MRGLGHADAVGGAPPAPARESRRWWAAAPMEAWVDVVFETRRWTLLPLGQGVRDVLLGEGARRRLGDPPAIVVFPMRCWGKGAP